LVDFEKGGGMSGTREYSVTQLDLGTAGYHTFDQIHGVVRFIRAENASGTLAPSAKVNIELGTVIDDVIPMSVGNAIKARDTRRARLTWAAQSGITAWFFLSHGTGEADMDADPPATVLANSVGETLASTADESVATVATELVLAANAARRHAILSNPASNAREFRIGDSSAGAARGMILEPGQTIQIEGRAEIYAYNPHSVAQIIALLETED
jgi:hypothetical protein